MNKKINDIFKQFRQTPVDEAFVDLLRVRLLETMEADARIGLARELVAPRAPFSLPMRRLVPALLVLSLVLTSGGTVFASQGSLPGETLYPVKLLSEEVRVAVALTAAKKAELQVSYAAERAREIDAVVAQHATSTFTESETKDIDHALANYTNNLEGADHHADEVRARGDDNEADKINAHLSEAALTYRGILERTASSTEEESVREHLHAAASSTDAIQKKSELKSHESEEEINTIEKINDEHATSTLSRKDGERAEQRAQNIKADREKELKNATSAGGYAEKNEPREEHASKSRSFFWFFGGSNESQEIKKAEPQETKDNESASIEKAVKSAENAQKEDEH